MKIESPEITAAPAHLSRRDLLKTVATAAAVPLVGAAHSALAHDDKAPHTHAPASTIAVGGHTLPKLDYAYDALEPFIDARTMELHHSKHHQSYVDGLNKAEQAFVEARDKNDFGRLAQLERDLAFHGNGHLNHTVFWANMAPKAKAQAAPGKALATALDRDFGSFDKFKAHLREAGLKVEANGWTGLFYHPGFGRLYVAGLLNHQNYALTGATPLLLCDVWEHAYYLKYQNKRADYLDAWWNVIQWADVDARYAAATK
jgi:superoxide dismutase, Fe-Mn family